MGKNEEIRLLLQKQVSKASIAKIVGVTPPTIYRFIKAGGYAQGYAHTLKGAPVRILVKNTQIGGKCSRPSDRHRPLKKGLGLQRWHPIPRRAAGNGQKLGAYADLLLQ